MDPEEGPPDGRRLWERKGPLTRTEKRARFAIIALAVVVTLSIVTRLWIGF